MKKIHYFVVILLAFSCTPKKKVMLDIPWFVNSRIYNDSIQTYNYRDSLDKYSNFSPDDIINKANFLSYLANLNYVVHPDQTAKTHSYIKASLQADSIAFCKKFIAPINNYLTPVQRPDRRRIMPFILNYNINYFLSLRQQCVSCCSEKTGSTLNKMSDLSLQISFISLRDQRHRNPNKKRDTKIQMKYDSLNRILLDQLLVSYILPSDDINIRTTIYTLLLHSNDCPWSKKWLSRYMNVYSGYDKYEQNLQHFLRRSDCSNDFSSLLSSRS